MPKKTSICDLFIKRQMGIFTKSDFDDLRNKASFLADTQIVRNQHIKNVRNITADERSSYVIDSSVNGLAITSHTNRCVSVIDTANMEKVREIKRNQRTIWTVAIHPYDSSLIATGSLDGYVSIYKNFKLHRSHNNHNYLRPGPITSISFHPTYDMVCYAIHHKIYLWFWEQDVKQSLKADEKLNIKYAKFNPVNKMLITGIVHDNHEENCYSVEKKMDDLINKNIQFTATYFIIQLFEILNTILDVIEFKEHIDIAKRWNEMFSRIVTFAYLLEKQAVVLLKQKEESRINYLQDFGVSLSIFKRKINEIEENIDNYYESIRSLNIKNIDAEISALRTISNIYYSETALLKNRCDIEQDNLEFVFRKINNIVILYQHDLSCFDKLRVFANHSRYQCKLQAWDLDLTNYPDLKQGWRNVITNCVLHNDSTVDVSRNGKIIVSFRAMADLSYSIGAYSLDRTSLGEIIYSHKISNATAIMSVSMSPSFQYILVGVRSDRVYGYFLQISQKHKEIMTKFELYDNDSNDSISFLKWMSRPGDGIIIGYNSFHLRFIRHF